MLAKLENNKLVVCPRNGYSGGNAISNIDVYYANNPEAAEADGWREFVPLDEPVEKVSYKEADGKIYEVAE